MSHERPPPDGRTRQSPPAVPFPLPTVGEIALLTLIFMVFGAMAFATISQGSPLGDVESVYALRARQITTGTQPISYWLPYRAPGLPAVLQIAWLAPATEPYLRVVVAAFGAVLVASTWFMGHLLGGVRVGLIAAGGIAITPTILISTTQVWPDVPGAAIGMLTLAVFAWSVSRDHVSRWVLLVPVMALVTTFLRFGAPIPLAIGLVALTFWRRTTALASWRLVTLTAALTFSAVAAVLFVPGFTTWAQSGGSQTSPYAAIVSQNSANGFAWHRGFQDYWRTRSLLVGGGAGILLATGITGGILFATRRQIRRRELWLAVGIGIATASAISLVLHGEARYLSPAFPWMWIGAAFGLAEITRIWTKDLAVVVAATVFLLISLDTHERSGIQNQVNRDRHQVVKDAANAIDDTTTDYACSVITGDTAIVGWYSKCPTNRYDTNTVVVDNPGFPSGPRFLFLIDGGERQPEADVLAGYLETTVGDPLSFGDTDSGRRQHVEVYNVDQ